MSDKLSPAYLRNLAATCRRVEQSLFELEDVLQQKEPSAITRQITHSYSPEQRKSLLAAILDVRRLNESLFRDLHLKSATTDETQMVHARFSQLWTILVDSKPNALKGSGDIPEEEAKSIERHVSEMIARMNTALENN